MRIILQRVASATCTINGQQKSAIGPGLLVLLGIEHDDDATDSDWLIKKLVALRIFADDDGHMNRSIGEINGEFLVISQFTLHASTKKGNRPSFIRAARPEQAIPLYEDFIQKLAAESGRPVATGEFGADMKIALVNDGPVTIFIDSKSRE